MNFGPMNYSLRDGNNFPEEEETYFIIKIPK